MNKLIVFCFCCIFLFVSCKNNSNEDSKHDNNSNEKVLSNEELSPFYDTVFLDRNFRNNDTSSLISDFRFDDYSIKLTSVIDENKIVSLDTHFVKNKRDYIITYQSYDVKTKIEIPEINVSFIISSSDPAFDSLASEGISKALTNQTNFKLLAVDSTESKFIFLRNNPCYYFVCNRNGKIIHAGKSEEFDAPDKEDVEENPEFAYYAFTNVYDYTINYFFTRSEIYDFYAGKVYYTKDIAVLNTRLKDHAYINDYALALFFYPDDNKIDNLYIVDYNMKPIKTFYCEAMNNNPFRKIYNGKRMMFYCDRCYKLIVFTTTAPYYSKELDLDDLEEVGDFPLEFDEKYVFKMDNLWTEFVVYIDTVNHIYKYEELSEDDCGDCWD